jgi:hypothetical protein
VDREVARLRDFDRWRTGGHNKAAKWNTGGRSPRDLAARSPEVLALGFASCEVSRFV